MLAGFRRGQRRRSGPDPGRHAALTAMRTPPARARSPSSRSPTATTAWWASTSPAPRRLPALPSPRRVRVPARRDCHITIHAGEAFGLPSIYEAWSSAAPTARSRRPHRRRHRGRPRRRGHAWAARRASSETCGSPWSCAPRPTCRPARPPRRRTPHRPAQAPAVPGHRQHRQPADERHLDVPEMLLLFEAFGWGWDDLEWLTINAMKQLLPSTSGFGSSTSRSSPATRRSSVRTAVARRRAWVAPVPGTRSRPSGGGAQRGRAGCGPAQRTNARRSGAGGGSVGVRASSRCAHAAVLGVLRRQRHGQVARRHRQRREQQRTARSRSRRCVPTRAVQITAPSASCFSDQPQNVLSK